MTGTGLHITPSGQACGARIRGIDLSRDLSAAEIADIRQAWLDYHVISFPDQKLTDADLERIAFYFGDFGVDTFFGSIEGSNHIAAVRRDADETTPIFADIWHTDWSFQKTPPSGTLLYGIDIPPEGGDTYFADQHKALEDMPAALRQKLEGKTGVHSAILGYSKGGAYGEDDQEKGRSMDIRPSDEEARKQNSHPIIRDHPEIGQPGIFGTIGAYVVGIEGMDEAEAMPLLMELSAWQTQDRFVYRHKWQPDMLVMWDNRSVLHRASGGYEGHNRLLHRITIAERAA